MKKKVNVFRIIQFVIGVLKLAIEIFNFRSEDESEEVTSEDMAEFTAEFSDLTGKMVQSIFKNVEDKEKFENKFIATLKKQKYGTDAV